MHIICHPQLAILPLFPVYYKKKRAIMKPQAVEFLLHMSLATAAASVNSLAEDVMVDEVAPKLLRLHESVGGSNERRYPVRANHVFFSFL
jgi:hypothetical protein